MFALPAQLGVNAGLTPAQFFELFERNTHLIYPGLGVLVIVLITVGIVQAWKEHDLDGLEKAEFKREIILQLRRDPGGISGEQIARAINLDPFKTVKLLEEMQHDGLVNSFTSTERRTVWRLTGLGGSRG